MSRINTFISPSEWKKECPQLSAESAHHLARVLRVKAGQEVTVFNGVGGSATAIIESVSKQKIELRVTAREQLPLPNCAITLVQALPKGAKIDLILQKSVELGCQQIIPLQTENAVVRLKPDESKKKQERWEKIILNAAEQSGAAQLPKLAPVTAFPEFIAGADQFDAVLVGALDEPVVFLKEALRSLESPKSIAICIGPEGDFSPAEMSSFREASAQCVSFGTQILRTETAALYALSVCAYELL